MWIVIGFAALGFLIGNLVGLTAHSVVTSVLTLMFAFAGSSIIAFLGKISPDDRRVAGQAICGLSLCCVLGTYAGIATSEWRLLSPKQAMMSGATAVSPATAVVPKTGNCEVLALKNKYLDYLPVARVNAVDWSYHNGPLKGKPAEAYENLYSILNESPNSSTSK